MVDAANLFAALAEHRPSTPDGEIDTGILRETFTRARNAPAQTRRSTSHLKTAVTMNVYVLDGDGTVIYDSDGGKAEGEDYSRVQRFHPHHGRASYGARSTRAGRGRSRARLSCSLAAPILP